jgi:hypothetical protein
MRTQSPSYASDFLVFIPFGIDTELKTGMQRNIHCVEFTLFGPVEVFERTVHCAQDKRQYSEVVMCQHIRRKPGFYVGKIVSLLFLLGAMVWAVPILPPDALNDRFIISLTLLLTQVRREQHRRRRWSLFRADCTAVVVSSQIAFNFILVDSLPKVSYLTSLDTYLLVNYIFLSLSILENVVVYLVQRAYPTTHYGRNLDYATIGLLITVHLLNTARFFWQGWKHSRKRWRPEERKLLLDMVDSHGHDDHV